jgi:TonB family protein
MRSSALITAACVLLCPFGSVGQQKQRQQVKIICPPLPVKILQQIKPEYPKEAKQSGIEGRVSLRCLVRPDGTVDKIEIISGEEPFVEAAKVAVGKWKYQRLVLNGVAVKFDTTVQVIFQLPKKLKNKQS